MDKVTVSKLMNRPNYLKDHNLKYLEMSSQLSNTLGKLREIAESLPNGSRKETMINAIAFIHNTFQEVLKDYDALQEGSVCRNALEDVVGMIKSKEREITLMTEIINKINKS